MVEDVNIEKIDLLDLKPADYNPRKISDKDKDKLKKSLKEFGLVEPLLINLKNNTVIGGHQRLSIVLDLINNDKEFPNQAYLLKRGDIGWVFLDEDLNIKDENHEKALNLALNRINAEWDFTKLTPLLDELQPFKAVEFTGFDIALKDISYEPLPTNHIKTTNTSSENIDEIDLPTENVKEVNLEPIRASEFPKETIIEEEIEPEVIDITEEETPNTTKDGDFIEYGDIYRLGNNVIMLGDYTVEEEKQQLIESLKRYNHQMTYGKEITKIATSKDPINYFMTKDAKLMEDQIWDYEVSTDEKAIHLNPKYEQEESEIPNYIW